MVERSNKFASTLPVSLLVALLAFAVAVCANLFFVGISHAENLNSSQQSSLSSTASAVSESAASKATEGTPAVETIEDDENALSAGVTSTWSIADLLMTIGIFACCITLLSRISTRRLEGRVRMREAVLGGISVVPAVVSVVLIAFTQDFAMPASFLDEMTSFFAVLLVFNVCVFIVAKVIMGKSNHRDLDANGPDAANAQA